MCLPCLVCIEVDCQNATCPGILSESSTPTCAILRDCLMFLIVLKVSPVLSALLQPSSSSEATDVLSERACQGGTRDYS